MVFCLSVFWVASAFSPGAWSQKIEYPWKLQLELSTIYDNNILRYSEKYLTMFMDRTEEARFRITSSDDIITNASMRLERSFEAIESLTSSMSAEVRQWKYMQNGVKNWSTIAFAARQELPARLAAGVNYSYLPEYYVRHYRVLAWVRAFGNTPDAFQPFSYTKDELRTWVQSAFFQNTRVRLTFGLQRYFHNEHFTEYNSNNTLWGIDASHPLFRDVRIWFGYEYVLSKARGFDVASSAASNVEGDASFKEDSFLGGIDVRLPNVFRLRNNITVSGEYSHKVYSTRQFFEVDPLHAGRQDYDAILNARYILQLSDQWDVEAAYGWRERLSRTTAAVNQAYVGDEKNYHQYQIELTFVYTLQM